MILFLILALLSLVGGVLTIAASNAIHAVLGLVGTLISLAMLYVTLDAHFLAAVQVIVYAGAVMVLFLFVVMLLNAARPVSSRDPIPYVRELAVIFGVLLAGSLLLVLNGYAPPRSLANAASDLAGGAPGPVGAVLLSKFLLPFEAVSLLLLVAVIGSVALVLRPQVQEDPAPEPAAQPGRGETA